MERAVVIGGAALVERDIGRGTSMDAEWLALIRALELARSRGLGAFVLLGDSVAVVDQANGRTRSRGDSLGHRHAFDLLVADGERPRVRYVKRAQNLAGIALARAHDR